MILLFNVIADLPEGIAVMPVFAADQSEVLKTGKELFPGAVNNYFARSLSHLTPSPSPAPHGSDLDTSTLGTGSVSATFPRLLPQAPASAALCGRTELVRVPCAASLRWKPLRWAP